MVHSIRMRAASLGAVGAIVLALSVAHGATSPAAADSDGGVVGPTLPLNDLEAMLALSTSQLANQKPAVVAPGPTLKAVPAAHCDSASTPLKGVQGRVSAADIKSAQAAKGWTCNTKQIGRYKTPGGFRVWRYTDPAGHICAFYDTSFLAPANIVSLLGGPSLGVEVLDMKDPSHPRHTATLTSLAMLAPHESLNLNAKRGLLAAEVGNGLTLPGTMDVYDVKSDCRHPKKLSQTPILTGHESGFSPDGKTFWVAGGAGYIYAFDLTDPRHPEQIWKGAYYAHGLNLSADGNTLYQTDPINGNLGILDVSQIQKRVAHPKVHDISRVTWSTVSIPQNSVPFTSHGHNYLVEFEEFAFRFNPATVADKAGAARILNIDNPAKPRIASNVRLQVNMLANHKKYANDPSALPPMKILGNAFHYCATSSPTNPTLLACSTINSGLRVFNISDPTKPREVAYFISPPKAAALLGLLPGDVAVSQPAFDAKRHEIWYTDASSGFYAVKLSSAAWPR
jgi:hypothetical protein